MKKLSINHLLYVFLVLMMVNACSIKTSDFVEKEESYEYNYVNYKLPYSLNLKFRNNDQSFLFKGEYRKGNYEIVFKEIIYNFNQVFGPNLDKDDSTKLHIDLKFDIDPIPNTWGWYGTLELKIIDKLNNQIMFYKKRKDEYIFYRKNPKPSLNTTRNILYNTLNTSLRIMINDISKFPLFSRIKEENTNTLIKNKPRTNMALIIYSDTDQEKIKNNINLYTKQLYQSLIKSGDFYILNNDEINVLLGSRKLELLNGTAPLSSVFSYQKIKKNIEEISKILSVKNVIYYVIEKKGFETDNLTYSDRKLYGPIDKNYYAISINVFDSEKEKNIYSSSIYVNIGDNVTSWTGDDEYASDFDRLNRGILYAPQKYQIDIKRQEMKAASDSLNFEQAIILRDEINKLEIKANQLLQVKVEGKIIEQIIQK